MKFKFNPAYFALAVLFFMAEAVIGLYITDAIIRPYGGDFLVVILVYCAVKSFADTPLLPTVIGVLLFAYAVEITQYFHLINRVGLGNNKAAQLIMGTHFAFTDLAAYTLGMITVFIVENRRKAIEANTREVNYRN